MVTLITSHSYHAMMPTSPMPQAVDAQTSCLYDCCARLKLTTGRSSPTEQRLGKPTREQLQLHVQESHFHCAR